MPNYSYPLNIDKTKEITINEFTKEVITFSVSNSKIVYMPLPKDDPIH